jgi:hypothetical protein
VLSGKSWEGLVLGESRFEVGEPYQARRTQTTGSRARASDAGSAGSCRPGGRNPAPQLQLLADTFRAVRRVRRTNGRS